jgi:hypothetical protein
MYAPTISPYDDYVFTTILFVIHYILDPCVLCLGLVGNILAFLVLLQPQYRNQTTCLYMRILAVFDTSIILLKNVPVRPVFFQFSFIIKSDPMPYIYITPLEQTSCTRRIFLI